MTSTLLLAIGLGAGRIALPGSAPIGMDYLTYDAATHQVWVPAGNTGAVDVLDTKTYQVKQVLGFPTAPPRRPGRPNAGPSSVAVGDGVVWIWESGGPHGLRRRSGTSEARQLFSVERDAGWARLSVDDARALGNHPGRESDRDPGWQRQASGYAPSSGRARRLRLRRRTRDLLHEPRGFGSDAGPSMPGGRKILATYHPSCGQEGPRGLAVDGARRLLLVACTNGVVSLDLARRGKVKDHLERRGGAWITSITSPRAVWSTSPPRLRAPSPWPGWTREVDSGHGGDVGDREGSS